MTEYFGTDCHAFSAYKIKMLDLKSIFYLLTDAETAEARLKHSRMLRFFDRPEQNLSMSSVEKSLLAVSPERDTNFDSFNQNPAKIRSLVT